MASIYDVDQGLLVEKTAEELKQIQEITAPEWAPFVKTGTHKERAPVSEDWWYYRAASVLRRIYKLGPIGVSKLRTKYGGKKNCGVRPGQFFKASGNILRKILQQLEKAELVKQTEVKGHKGRVIAPKGNSLLDKVSASISKSTKKEVPKTSKKEAAKETKEPAPKKAPKAEKKEAKKAEKTPAKKAEPKKEVKEEKKEDSSKENKKEE